MMTRLVRIRVNLGNGYEKKSVTRRFGWTSLRRG
jgi:hypothetical protein